MCGIFGYTGDTDVAAILLDALSRLEYRGYDSAGVATLHEGNIYVGKDTGHLDAVTITAGLRDMPGKTGIGHVRWATHGGVTRGNAHPHCDEPQQIAVVHNGIIDNYAALKERLSLKYRFVSETDTEVIPHLIREQIDAGYAFPEAFARAIAQLAGSYAIAAVTTLEPGRIYAARQGSPLIVGLGRGANYIGSDVISFLPYTRRALYIEDGETAVLDKDTVRVYHNGRGGGSGEVAREPVSIDWEYEQSGKGIYDHYMLKEILEQPDAICRAVEQDEQYINRTAIDILRNRQTTFTACGTSRHAALIGRYAFSKIGRIFSEVVMASEFGYFSDSVDKNTLVIAISQSGETADVLDGVKQARLKGATIFSLVNVNGSSLAQASDRVLNLKCGPEICVAATKSFTAQVSVLYLLAYAMDGQLAAGRDKLKKVAGLIQAELPGRLPEIRRLAEKMKNERDFYFLARGINYAMAGEGALKLKEVAYVHAEGMAAGELKHGTLALIGPGTPVVAVCPTDYTYAETIANVEEAKARGAFVIGISDMSNPVFDEWIKIPAVDEVLYPLVTAVPLQLLAYYSAVCRGLDPDKPRNLAKSVTVK